MDPAHARFAPARVKFRRRGRHARGLEDPGAGATPRHRRLSARRGRQSRLCSGGGAAFPGPRIRCRGLRQPRARRVRRRLFARTASTRSAICGRVIDQVGSGPVVVIGSSLGAAVGLQAAAEDPRISAVVAAESFSDLKTVATERAPWFFTDGAIRRSFALAERLGRFRVEEVSPVAAAARIHVPVFLIHGADRSRDASRTLAAHF